MLTLKLMENMEHTATASPKTTLPTALLQHSGSQTFIPFFHIMKIKILTYKLLSVPEERDEISTISK